LKRGQAAVGRPEGAVTERWIERVEQCLWPRRSTADIWMILDAARDPSIFPMLRDWPMQSSCLYSGPLPRALAVVAPYLARLDRDHPATHRLLALAWGNSWGVFLACDARLDDLRRHLRTFLMVRDPHGHQLLFRYYDPRVLRVYLPTCDRQELDHMFGPVDRFWTEHRSPDKLLEFGTGQSVLKTRIHDLATADAAMSRALADDGGRRVRSRPRTGVLTIRLEQLDVFSQHERRKFQDWMVAHVTKFFPQQCTALGAESKVRDLIWYGVARSATYGITAKREVCKYVDLMMVLGRDFDTDERLGWAARILTQPGRPGDKMTALYEAIKDRSIQN